MKNIKHQLILIFSITYILSYSQFTGTQVNTNATILINNLLASGIVSSNHSINCSNNSSGTFTNGGALGISDGVVLSTGNILDISQTSTILAFSSNSFSGDSDLDSLLLELGLQYGTMDACVLEFDVIAVGDTFMFN